MSHFRTCGRATLYLLPPSVEDWLPQGHLARFVVEIVDQLDLSSMLSLLIYGYATGTYSSQRIEEATYESLAFRYIAANSHPDLDTLCTFRKRFLGEIESRCGARRVVVGGDGLEHPQNGGAAYAWWLPWPVADAGNEPQQAIQV